MLQLFLNKSLVVKSPVLSISSSILLVVITKRFVVQPVLFIQGITGAQKTGVALQQVEFTAAYSSILQRAIDTAGHIIGQRPIPLFQHCGLNEQSFGSWEGMQIADLRKLTEFKQLTNDPAAYKALSNGGKTFEQLAVRAMAALYDIVKVHQSGANILVVSYG